MPKLPRASEEGIENGIGIAMSTEAYHYVTCGGDIENLMKPWVLYGKSRVGKS